MNRYFLTRSALAVVVATCARISAAEPPPNAPDSELVLTLQAAKPTKCTTLTSDGRILAPRSDTLVPAGLVALLKDETVVRVYPWCTFQLEDGHPVWSWTLWNSSGLRGEPADTKNRLTQRLTDLGFKSFDAADERFPNGYRREDNGRRETVLLRDPASWVGGREPSVGIELEWTVRSSKAVTRAMFAEVVEAMPTLLPPERGTHRIPDGVVAQLMRCSVSKVSLSSGFALFEHKIH